MHFRYKDHRGKVVVLKDVNWLAQAVRNGLITPDTPLAIGDEENFRSAESVVAYQQVVVALERNRLGTSPQVGAPRIGEGTRSRTRLAALVVVGVAALALIYFLIRPSGSPPSAVSVTARPSPEMQAALDLLVTEFGDSIALRQRRLEQWLARQGLDGRVRGRALQTAGSLRALRSAAAEYLVRVDSLQTGASVVASRLVLRADSLEGTDGVRHGLFAAAGDALRGWEDDLAAFAELQRATAATLDSLAEFALSRTQSFVVRDGEAVFLNRDDAARYRELVVGLNDLASKEQRWADNVRAKHPGWMAALAPADRPAFRQPQNQRSNQ